MVVTSKDGCPAKSGCRKDIAAAPHLLCANVRHPQVRISKQNSALD